jgi:hypothetical protein
MASYHAPREWEDWSEWLAAGLHGRSRWRLPLLMTGLLFAGGRRVVASWIRAADVSDDYRDYYFFLQSVGRRWPELGRRVLVLVLRQVLSDQQRVLVAIDDSPTKRYGPQVQGAGIHHDPTPGPAGPAFCYGHVWVTLAVIVRHPQWGTIGLPIWSWLYVRRQDVAKMPARHGWVFQTKLEQAADLVLRAVETLQNAGKDVWVVADGAYTKRPFVRPAMDLGVTLVGRLRKDAALRDLPPREQPGAKKRRGRKRKYGKHRLSLAKRAAHPRGWRNVTCSVYGTQVVKRFKTFLATHRTFGGAIRVVIVKEKTGPQFFYCTDVKANPAEIIEAFADRAAIEQALRDVKVARREGSLGQRPTADAKCVDEHRRLAPQLVDAHPGRTVGLEPVPEAIGPPRRLALGRCGETSVSRRPPQSLTGGLLGKRVFARYHSHTAPTKNPHPAQTPAPHRPVSTQELRKCRVTGRASAHSRSA